MCYMVLRAGVRELRQNASQLLAHVAEGEIVEITSHGRAVARLVPIDLAYPRALAVLLEDGLVHRGAASLAAIEPVPAPPGTAANADLLDEQRAER